MLNADIAISVRRVVKRGFFCIRHNNILYAALLLQNQ